MPPLRSRDEVDGHSDEEVRPRMVVKLSRKGNSSTASGSGPSSSRATPTPSTPASGPGDDEGEGSDGDLRVGLAFRSDDEDDDEGPAFIHEYRLTPYSLYAAVSVGLNPNDIIEVLNRLSKAPVPETVHNFILNSTVSFGKIKLVLKQNKYFVESAHPEVLRMLLQDEVIGQARVKDSDAGRGNKLEVNGQTSAPTRGDLVIPGTESAARRQQQLQQQSGGPQQQPAIGPRPGAPENPANRPPNAAGGPTNAGGTGPAPESATAARREAEADLFDAIIGVDETDEAGNDDEDVVHSFEIEEKQIEAVKKRCQDLQYPMLEEYDFRNDTMNADLDIDLRPITHIRPYQEKSLSKMFGNGEQGVASLSFHVEPARRSLVSRRHAPSRRAVSFSAPVPSRSCNGDSNFCSGATFKSIRSPYSLPRAKRSSRGSQALSSRHTPWWPTPASAPTALKR
ncbi:hypothetical protein L7F22_056835 [Adiantum nelumboides]|nr:hypothetical protein [Adiantum nelumboides]